MRIRALFAMVAAALMALPLQAASPAAPLGLTATATGASRQVALSWQDVPPVGSVTGYHVFYNSISDQAGSSESYVTSTTAIITVDADRALRYFMVASDDVGAAGAGVTGTVVSAAAFQAPDAPALTVTAIPYQGTVRLNWSQPTAYGTSLGGFRLETLGASGNSVVGNYGPGVTATTVSVGCGAGVSFVARAYDAFGASSVASAAGYAALPCAPSVVASSLSSGSLHLAWAPTGIVPSVAQWEIRRATAAGAPDGSMTLETVVASTTLSWDLPAPAQRTPLYAKVYAVTGMALTSTASNEVALLQAPGDVNATGRPGSVSLQWSKVSGNSGQAVTEYQVYYSTDSAVGFSSVSRVPAVAGTLQGVTVTGLPSNATRYYFTVAAAGGSGTVQVGPPSLTVSALTGLASPVFSAVTALSNSAMSFAWGAVDVGANTPAAYYLQRSASSDLSSPVLLTATTLVGVTSVAAPAPGTLNWYFVTVTDSAGSLSSLSPTGSAVLRLPSLAAPVLAAAVTGNARVQLQWQSVPEASYYQVYRATAFGFSALLNGKVTGLNYTDTDPVNGGANYYQVNAFVPVGIGSALHASPVSNNVTALPSVGPGIPGAYGSSGNGATLAYLTAVAATTGGVDLHWAAPALGSSATSRYQVWRGFSAQTQSLLTTLYGATQTSYADAAAPVPLQSLVYGVEAVDAAGAVSARLTGTVGAVLPWAVPSSASLAVISAGVRLSWASPTGGGSYALSAYAVSRRWQTGGAYLDLTRVAGLAYVDPSPDASQGSQPSYQIQVLDVGGHRGSAVTLTAQLAAAAPSGGLPSAVTSVTAVTLAESLDRVSLQWAPNPEGEAISAYAVYRGALAVTRTASTSYLDSPGLGSSTVYQVQALNAQGAGLSTTASPAPIFDSPPQPSWVSPVATVDAARADGTLSLRLIWEDLSAPSAVDGYRVYQTTGATFSPAGRTLLATLSSTAYADTAAPAGVTQSYAVVAYSGAYESASPVAQLTLLVPPTPLSISGLTATARTDGASLSWDAEPSATEYWVFRSSSAFTAYPDLSTPPARVTSNSYLDSGADASTLLHYAVASVNLLGRAAVTQTTVSPLGGTPVSLSATPGYAASAKVDLAWSAPTGTQSATSYEVWRATSVGQLGGSPALLLTSTAALSYTDPSLVTNTAYVYGVRGIRFSAGPFVSAGPLRAYQAPSVPQILADGTDGGVDLAWSPAVAYEGVTAWALSLSVTGNLSSLTLAAATTGYRVSGLLPGDGVSFSLAALNSAGGSAFSPTATAFANAVGPAPQPVSFSALSGYSGGSSTGARVRLDWSAPGAPTVLIYRAVAPMGLSLAAGGTSSPYYLTGLSGVFVALTDTVSTPGTRYDYALTALSAAGLPGGESAPRPASVLARRAASLVGLTGTAGSGRVDLVWSRPDDSGSPGLATKPYRLHRQTGGGTPTFASVADDTGFPIDLSGNAYVDGAVINGTSYWYFLSTVDADGEESREAAVPHDSSGNQASMAPQGPPSPPSALIAVPGDGTVTLRWVATSAVAASGAKYNVYRRQAGADYGSAIPELYQVGPELSDLVGLPAVVLTLRDGSGAASPPQNKVNYVYSISSVNKWGEGPKSQEISVTPFRPLDPGMNSAANRALGLSVLNKKDIALSWGATPDQAASDGYALASYRVYRSQNGGNNYDLLATLTSTAYVDLSTSYGGAYTYRVVPVDVAGNEGYSYTLQTVVIPAAVNSVLLFRNAFNPAIGEQLPVQYAIQQSGHVWVKVFTLNGEYVATIFDEDVPNASADQPFLSSRKTWDGHNSEGQLVASGVYLIHLEAPGYRQNARVAVIK